MDISTILSDPEPNPDPTPFKPKCRIWVDPAPAPQHCCADDSPSYYIVILGDKYSIFVLFYGILRSCICFCEL
jgi:hypothetical protein